MRTRTLLVGGAIAALFCAPTAFAAGQSAMQQDQAASEVEAPPVGETEAEAEARRARMMDEGTDTGATTEAGAMTDTAATNNDTAAGRSSAVEVDDAADAADVEEAKDGEEEEEEERQTPA